MSILTRLAPSPTGFMHIGTARTGLFSWLYAHARGGKFALRIEDTDRSEGRWFPEAPEIVYSELRWLGLDWDMLVESQLANAMRHAEIARELLARGAAYECYLSAEELEKLREEAKKTGKPIRSPYRDGGMKAPAGVKPVVRLRMPDSGKTIIHDLIQGDIEFDNAGIEDLVILRSDGTPTYNLSVAVDDHDMGVSHVIRGADHISNTPKQMRIYEAMGWSMPAFAHAPLILAMDGSKMSKRHGATTVGEYRELGVLPEALFNYLLRLGWSHGNDEIISREQALKWFDIKDVGASPAKFDHAKLIALNAIYIRAATNERLAELLKPFMGEITAADWARVVRGIPDMKERVKTLAEMADMAQIYLVDGWKDLPKAADIKGVAELSALTDWTAASINECFKSIAAKYDMKIGNVVAPLRMAISGKTISPPLAEAMEIIGKEESIRRLK